MKIIASFLTLAIAASAGAQSPVSSMERAVNAYSAMKTMRAEFQQTITNPLTGTRSVSRGVILRRSPNLLSVNFTDPKGDRVVADGKSVWVYLPSSAPGQVIRMPAEGNGSMSMVDPGGLFMSAPASRYTITGAGTATVSGRRLSAIVLVPKKANSAFNRAKVWIDPVDNSIRQFEVEDVNGLTRLVTITSLKSNVTI
ncbi:MAG TPA: outer membrane lipoprotein carrier protein LolA, partial [Gemmatimonadaceae bacterium]|nr:outer membrane lipoprotein carrier protein LolA [Gemmatimonadaceae bacterium]